MNPIRGGLVENPEDYEWSRKKDLRRPSAGCLLAKRGPRVLETSTHRYYYQEPARGRASVPYIGFCGCWNLLSSLPQRFQRMPIKTAARKFFTIAQRDHELTVVAWL